MIETILTVDSLYKKFSRSASQSIKSALVRSLKKSAFLNVKSTSLDKGEFWALKNVSFDLYAGEVIGIVGVNGSGKTTLLKCLCSLLEPDSGTITTGKRLVGLFATGAGFNPSLTGFENIRLYLSLLGLNGKPLEEQSREAVAFCELSEDILNSPIRTYSSGMRARLGFACVINSKPDVLIIDEALAVGDLRFRRKCYQMIASLKRSGVSFILVSHSSSTILSHCDRVIFLKKGKVISIGDPHPTIEQFEKDMLFEQENVKAPVVEITQNEDNEKCAIRELSFIDKDGNRIKECQFNSDSTLRVWIESRLVENSDIVIKVVCRELFGDSRILFFKELPIVLKSEEQSLSTFEVDIDFKPLMLLPGAYTFKVLLTTSESFDIIGAKEGYRFKILGQKSEQGVYFQRAEVINTRRVINESKK